MMTRALCSGGHDSPSMVTAPLLTPSVRRATLSSSRVQGSETKTGGGGREQTEEELDMKLLQFLGVGIQKGCPSRQEERGGGGDAKVSRLGVVTRRRTRPLERPLR